VACHRVAAAVFVIWLDTLRLAAGFFIEKEKILGEAIVRKGALEGK
jgi:hypothetical protein